MLHGGVILGKTRKGAEELAHRTGTVSQKVRSVLILLDGKTRYAELIQKCAFLPSCSEHIEWLLHNGFVEAVLADAGSAAMPVAPVQPRAASIMAPPLAAASPKTALLAMAQELLGNHAAAVVQRLQDTEDSRAALSQTVERCHKLIRLSIDEKKAEQFRNAGLALLTPDEPSN